SANRFVRGFGSAGTRTRNQRLKRALLYRLSYRPARFQFPVAKEIFNPEPTPKAFGAALPIELPTRAGASLCNAREIFQCRMTPLDDLPQTQMHLRRGAEDRFDKRQGHSRQGVETAPEFMADQAANGNVLDRIWWTKEPHPGRAVFVRSRRAPERNRAQTIRILFQVRICSQSMGPGCIAI